jgi:hypothetical protein
VIGAVELSLRALDPFGLHFYERHAEFFSFRYGDEGLLDWSKEPGVHYAPVPGASVRIGAAYRINQLGLRGPELPEAKAAGEFRVACLGDSVTFGSGVAEDDAWPSVLAQRLGATALNLGVPGHNTSEEVHRFLGLADRLEPDLVLVLAMANDFAKRDPGVFSSRLTWGWPRRLVTRLPYLYGLVHYARTGGRRLEAAGGLEGERSRDQEAWRHEWTPEASIKRLAREGADRGFDVMVFLYDPQRGSDPLSRLETACWESGVPVVWLPRDLRKDSPLRISPIDPHPSPLGHRVLAEQIHPELTRRGFVPSTDEAG